MFLLALVVARSALVLSLSDVFFYGEELAKGAAGKAMLSGPGIEHHRLAYHYYEGGGFVFSHLDALAFLLLGPSLLALKAVALGWSALALAGGWSLARRAFGGAGAACFGLLVVLAPASMQKLSLLALGIHLEACLFVALVLLLLVRIAVDGERSARAFGLLGLAAGFGIYFSFQLVLTAAFAALVLLVRAHRELLGRPGLALLIGFLVGLLPCLWMASRVGAQLLDIHGDSLLGSVQGPLQRHAAFAASLFEGRPPVELAALLLRLCLPVAGLAFLLRAGEEPRVRLAAGLIAGYLALFLAAYAASGFAVGPVYHFFRLNRLSQVWWLATLLAGGGLGRALWVGSALARCAAAAGIVALAALGARDLVRTASEGVGESWRSSLERLARTPGYAFLSYLAHARAHFGATVEQQVRVALRLDDDQSTRLRADIGSSIVSKEAHSLEEALELIEHLDPDGWREIALGLGPLWAELHGSLVEGRLGAIASAPSEVQALLLEACGRFGSGPYSAEAALQADIDAALAATAPEAWFEGLGWRGQRMQVSRQGGATWPGFVLTPSAARAFLERQAPAAREALLRGWSRAESENLLR